VSNIGTPLRNAHLNFHTKGMKNYKANRSYQILLSYLVMLYMLTSCSIIGGIFKTGVAVGIFLVIALIIIVIILINRFKKKY
jgi:hypothetical protein